MAHIAKEINEQSMFCLNQNNMISIISVLQVDPKRMTLRGTARVEINHISRHTCLDSKS